MHNHPIPLYIILTPSSLTPHPFIPSPLPPLPSHQPYASPPPLIHTIPPTLGVLCPIPIPPLDGEVSWSSNEVGAVLHYYCREGFDLVGTASQECLPIGDWSSYTPLCMKGESLGEGMHACEMQTPSHHLTWLYTSACIPCSPLRAVLAWEHCA